MMQKQVNARPTRKVTLGAATGAATAILVWVLNEFNYLPGGTDIPGDIGAALTTLLTFVVSYFVPPSANDGITDAEE